MKKLSPSSSFRNSDTSKLHTSTLTFEQILQLFGIGLVQREEHNIAQCYNAIEVGVVIDLNICEMYIDGEVKFEVVLGGQVGFDSSCDDIGVDLNNMIISKVLNQTVTYQPVGLVYEDSVLVGLRHRRVVLDLLLLHYLISVAIIHKN